MSTKVLTQEDLDQKPELVEAGYKVGDEIEVNDEPATDTPAEGQKEEGDSEAAA